MTITSRTLLGLASTLLVAGLALPASAQSPTEIVGFELRNADADEEIVELIALTRDGREVKADSISYKTKDRVMRVTYHGAVMAPGLADIVPLQPRAVEGVTKAYAVRDNSEGPFVRIRFKRRARRAMDGVAVQHDNGRTKIVFPFGKAITTTASSTSGPEPAPPEEAPAPAIAETETDVVEPVPAENKVEADAVVEAGPGADDERPVFDWADDKPETKAEESPVSASGGGDLQLADEAAGPNLTKVIGALFVVSLLIIVLALAVRKVKGLRGGGGFLSKLAPSSGVTVLETFTVGRGQKIVVMEVLGEVLVVSQPNSGAMTLLHRFNPDRVAQLQAAGHLGAGASPGFFQSLVTRGRPSTGTVARTTGPVLNAAPIVRADEDDVDNYAGTLGDLARSLEENAKAGERKTQKLHLTSPQPRVALAEEAPAAAAEAHNAETIDFQKLLARRAASRYAAADEEATSEESADVSRAYRERIRNLARLG